MAGICLLLIVCALRYKIADYLNTEFSPLTVIEVENKNEFECESVVKPLPYHNIFDPLKLKAFADDSFSLAHLV